jgi:asparagine synthetase B (glutamine-hydrolysing)
MRGCAIELAPEGPADVAATEPMADRLAARIFNYRELRRELEAAAYAFVSRSDTEVVSKAYHRWGIDCAQHSKAPGVVVR